ncbi:endonuclease [uncultured Tenacibaculum sp.]|uniref:endonuclease n=1 Tax=uncultured Tenacibaculum sp. TaxID=174713 RepID=UPI002628B8E0|nr:endonuclease [uncultured Tenacibaculum sp.]
MKKLLLLILFVNTYFGFTQQSYYNDVDLTKSGIALRDELATKIIATHTNFISYTPGVWEASRKTDVNPNNPNEVILIYGYSASGTTARTRGINENGGGAGEWNREHVYPRSLGDPTLDTRRLGDAGTDAHSLRPSDVDFNRLRSNKRFADGSGNAGDVPGGWYPGDEWKGDVARMMMYMYLHYGIQCLPTVVGVGSASATPDDMIDLFLKWNAEDPVSVIEDNRNTYHGDTSNTYAQGNRNPFIDNPNLATQIWGGPIAEDRWATASVKEERTLNAKVFPNPSISGNVSIYSNEVGINEIKVYSILGKEIYSKNNPVFQNQTFTVRNLNSGIYLLKIKNNNKYTTKKVIVN